MRGTAGASGRTAGSSRSAPSMSWAAASRVYGGVLPPLVRQLPGHGRHRVATATDFTPFSITTALIPRRTAFGRRPARCRATINTTGFYNVNDARRRRPTCTRLSDTMFPGSNVIDHWFGFDIGLNARLPHGIIFQGGLSTGHQTTDYCDVEDPAKAGDKALVEMLTVGVPAVFNSLNTCHMEQKWLPAGEVPRVVHGAEDRRADRRVVPEHPRHRILGARTRHPTPTWPGRCPRAVWAASQRRGIPTGDHLGLAASSQARSTANGSTSSTFASGRSFASGTPGRT